MRTAGRAAFQKRTFDLAIALPLFVLSLPIMAAICVLIYLDSGPPVVLVQERIGFKRRPFRMYKFRSMWQGAPHRTAPGGEAVVAEDDDRVTRAGRVLRSTGLDELPQLWNVVCGEMSLVGPRPYMRPQADLVPAWAVTRWDAKPGVVCLAEVMGRNALSWKRRLALDVAYVKRAHLGLDIRILAQAVPTALLGRGLHRFAQRS